MWFMISKKTLSIIFIALVLAILLGSISAFFWREQIVCLGGCNWEKIEANKGTLIFENFLFAFGAVFVLTLIVGFVSMYVYRKIKNKNY